MCDGMQHKTNLSDVQQSNKFEEHTIDKDYLIVNILLVPLSFVEEIHAMYINDIDIVINGKLCQNNCQMIFNTKNQNYKRDLASHLNFCQGPEITIQKLIATGQSDLLTPSLNYITLDFEALENENNGIDNLFAQQEQLSVASAATINDQITVLYFDLRD
ncbi:MAG: hypothetical protein EZS28_006359 [Streblomastix strix]|uniref:Uncharacterized protein n=1 Tax=Streblomastix strix TaxID=222440 RepID=A0A5J4WU56_9EUKA|nr:MAG: hypothetical protein EZS28_006359 [Streblomastix strix]